MANTIPIEQASPQLSGMIAALKPGEEIILTQNNEPVARIVLDKTSSEKNSNRTPGVWKGMLTIVEDDDEHLEDFKEYMP